MDYFPQKCLFRLISTNKIESIKEKSRRWTSESYKHYQQNSEFVINNAYTLIRHSFKSLSEIKHMEKDQKRWRQANNHQTKNPAPHRNSTLIELKGERK